MNLKSKSCENIAYGRRDRNKASDSKKNIVRTPSKFSELPNFANKCKDYWRKPSVYTIRTYLTCYIENAVVKTSSWNASKQYY